MGTPLRAILTTAAALLAATSLRAETGTWSGMLGAAMPSGGTKAWVGSAVGPSLDILETYNLGGHDAIRMRFGYWALKGSNTDPVAITLPGASTPEIDSASTTNQMFGFTYGAEYVRTLPVGFYVLGGLGVTYISATRSGTVNLQASGAVSTNYGANNFVPYVCAGFGYQFTQSLALEARWQTSSMKAQNRPIDLSNAGLGSGVATFDKRSTPTLTVGLNLSF